MSERRTDSQRYDYRRPDRRRTGSSGRYGSSKDNYSYERNTRNGYYGRADRAQRGNTTASKIKTVEEMKLMMARKRRERKKRLQRRLTITAIAVLACVAAVTIIIFKGVTAEPKPSVDDTMESPETATGYPLSTGNGAGQLQENIVVNSDYFENAAFIGNAFAAGIDEYGILPLTDFYAGVDISLDNVYTTAAKNSSTAVVDQLKSKKYSKVYLSFGELEMAWDDVAQFELDYEALIDKIREYQPSANIYVIAIPPVSESASLSSAAQSIRTIKEYNNAIKKAAVAKKVYYIDSFAAIGGNYLPEGVSVDGINLNKAYYAKILNYAQKNAAIPTARDLTSEIDYDAHESDTEDTADKGDTSENTSAAGSRTAAGTATESPENEDVQPTPNVLKNNAN